MSHSRGRTAVTHFGDWPLKLQPHVFKQGQCRVTSHQQRTRALPGSTWSDEQGLTRKRRRWSLTTICCFLTYVAIQSAATIFSTTGGPVSLRESWRDPVHSSRLQLAWLGNWRVHGGLLVYNGSTGTTYQPYGLAYHLADVVAGSWLRRSGHHECCPRDRR